MLFHGSTLAVPGRSKGSPEGLRYMEYSRGSAEGLRYME